MQWDRRFAVGAVVVGSLSLGVVGAAPAVADTGGYTRLAASEVGASSAPTPLANSVSSTFAGWLFQKAGNTSVTSVFKMPAVTCTPAQTGVSPGSFMVTGTTATSHFNGAGVIIQCIKGQAHANANTIIDGNETDDMTHALSAADLIKSTVTTTAAKTTATVSDLTHKFTFTKSSATPLGPALQEVVGDDSVVIVTSPGHGKQIPVVNFGQIQFSSGAVGGKPLGTVTPRVGVDMRTQANVLQIQTGALAGAAKNVFNTIFKHA